MKALLMASTLLWALIGSAKDVVPASRDHLSYLEVRKISQHVGFIYHRYPKDPGKFLGPRRFYSIEELRNLRTRENLDVLWSSLADAGIIALTITTGATGEALLYSVVTPGASGGAVVPLLGGLAGGAAGVAVDHFVTALNPVDQYDQARTLNEDVIQDRMVTVGEDQDLKEFVKRLEEALLNL